MWDRKDQTGDHDSGYSRGTRLQGVRAQGAGGGPAARGGRESGGSHRARHRRRHRRHLRCQRGRDLRRHGPVRLGQVHPHPDAQRSLAGHRWADLPGRRRARLGPARHASGDPPAPGLDGVPALRPSAPPDRPGERCLSAGDPRGRLGGTHPEGPRGARAGRPRRLGGLPARCPVRRHATAGRPRESAGRGHRRPAHGRGVLRPRPAHPAGDAGAAALAAGPAGQDDRLHHPRPQRGDVPRRPDRDDARRPHRPDRHSGRDPLRPGNRLRRPVRLRRRPHPCAHRTLGRPASPRRRRSERRTAGRAARDGGEPGLGGLRRRSSAPTARFGSRRRRGQGRPGRGGRGHEHPARGDPSGAPRCPARRGVRTGRGVPAAGSGGRRRGAARRRRAPCPAARRDGTERGGGSCHSLAPTTEVAS